MVIFILKSRIELIRTFMYSMIKRKLIKELFEGFIPTIDLNYVYYGYIVYAPMLCKNLFQHIL